MPWPADLPAPKPPLASYGCPDESETSAANAFHDTVLEKFAMTKTASQLQKVTSFNNCRMARLKMQLVRLSTNQTISLMNDRSNDVNSGSRLPLMREEFDKASFARRPFVQAWRIQVHYLHVRCSSSIADSSMRTFNTTAHVRFVQAPHVHQKNTQVMHVHKSSM